MQKQLNLTESKVQDYVEVSHQNFCRLDPVQNGLFFDQHASFRIDAQDTIIMGLPPPEVDNIISWRNYGLAHSIRETFLQVSP